MATEPSTESQDQDPYLHWRDLKMVLNLTATLVNLKLYSHASSPNWEVKLQEET